VGDAVSDLLLVEVALHHVSASWAKWIQVRKRTRELICRSLDIRLCLMLLLQRGWTLSDWDAVYEDLPSSMLKVEVPDRTKITTTDAEVS
jgi:hypothetical protein